MFSEWKKTLEDATSDKTANEMTHLFASILRNGDVRNPQQLFEEFLPFMFDLEHCGNMDIPEPNTPSKLTTAQVLFKNTPETTLSTLFSVEAGQS